MVAFARGRNHGASTIGCLFTVLIFVAVLYYGVDIGRIYWNYYRLEDEMQTSARFASTQSDDQIRKHLVGVSEDLGLPAEARRFTIRRTEHPPTVSIKTSYTVELELPFNRRTLTMRPEVAVRQ
jgi:phosphate/sulfate permease